MKILHLIDSLNPGGAERMAVGYVNALAERNFEVYLWSSREEGLLKKSIHPKVKYLFLNRKGPIGLRALLKASHLIKVEKIQLIHAHSTSWFFGTLLKGLNPSVKLIWHDHFGNSEKLNKRKNGFLKYFSRYFDAIFSVNELLKVWATRELKCNKVFYIKNFSSFDSNSQSTLTLNGVRGKRILCLANLRPQKNHLNLINAFSKVAKADPDWSLHLIGKNWGDEYFDKILKEISAQNLSNAVFYYGSQSGISAILNQADIGVLSSDSEGLPLAILEYAISGLPVVCTDVGHCKEVIQGHGHVVPPGDANALAQALLYSIQNPNEAAAAALKLQKHVQETYTEQAVLPQVIEIYERLLKSESKL